MADNEREGPMTFDIFFPCPSFCTLYNPNDSHSDKIFDDALGLPGVNKSVYRKETAVFEIQLACQQISAAHYTSNEEGCDLPLMTFWQKASVFASAASLVRCPFFAHFWEQSQNCPHLCLKINFASVRLMDAFLLVLKCLGACPSIGHSPDPLEKTSKVATTFFAAIIADDESTFKPEPTPADDEVVMNLLEIAGSASLLGHQPLQLHCELLLLKELDLETFVPVSNYSHVCRRELMMKALYFSMKRLGLRSLDNAQHLMNLSMRNLHEDFRVDNTSAKQVLKSRLKLMKQELRVSKKRGKQELKHQLGISPYITADPLTGEMVNKSGQRCPLSIFHSLINQEHQCKERFFNPKSYPIPPAERYSNGYPGLSQYSLHRSVSEDGFTTRYFLYEGDSAETLRMKLELAAIATADQQTFDFSTSQTDFTPYGDHYLGKMRSSFTGRFFHLYDYGLSENKMFPQDLLPGLIRKEHCLVVYSMNILGREPNQLQVLMPDPDLEGYNEIHHQSSSDPDPGPETNEESSLFNGPKQDSKPSKLAKKYSKGDYRGCRLLKTRQASWDTRIEAWTLDFKGRVKIPSKKNFLIVDPEDPDHPYMLFGKVTKNRFSLDCRAPLTPLHGFFIALTAFSTKLLVT